MKMQCRISRHHQDPLRAHQKDTRRLSGSSSCSTRAKCMYIAFCVQDVCAGFFLLDKDDHASLLDLRASRRLNVGTQNLTSQLLHSWTVRSRSLRFYLVSLRGLFGSRHWKHHVSHVHVIVSTQTDSRSYNSHIVARDVTSATSTSTFQAKWKRAPTTDTSLGETPRRRRPCPRFSTNGSAFVQQLFFFIGRDATSVTSMSTFRRKRTCARTRATTLRETSRQWSQCQRFDTDGSALVQDPFFVIARNETSATSTPTIWHRWARARTRATTLLETSS